MARCSPPQSVSVRPYARSAPRRKAKPAVYWECVSHGRGCGVHHHSHAASIAHSRRLDRAERRRGRKPSWEPVKRGGT